MVCPSLAVEWNAYNEKHLLIYCHIRRWVIKVLEIFYAYLSGLPIILEPTVDLNICISLGLIIGFSMVEHLRFLRLRPEMYVPYRGQKKYCEYFR